MLFAIKDCTEKINGLLVFVIHAPTSQPLLAGSDIILIKVPNLGKHSVKTMKKKMSGYTE